MPLVEFRNVSYDIAGKRILSEVNLSVEAGETLVLLGRSGSGKSTALKLTNGMLFPTEGQVLVEGRSTREWDPIKLKRHIGYVIQDVGLFPHFTVARNIGLVPRLEGWIEADIERRVDQLWTKSGCRLRNSGRGIRGSSPAASAKGSEWRARSPPIRRCSCSTSPSARSTR